MLLDSSSEDNFRLLDRQGIPVFAGKPWNVWQTFIAQVEAKWDPYRKFKKLWKARIVELYLEGRAQDVARDLEDDDFETFKTFMERRFPSAPARFYLKSRMCGDTYMQDMKLETAFLRATADYKSVGDGFDSVVPAYRLAERIPRQIIRNLPAKIYAYKSGRKLLKDLEVLTQLNLLQRIPRPATASDTPESLQST
ncbi:hypothetical protein GGI12_002242 [Dipsacomyces acuminosporus]|nr:hypothetical protein GGI12_002242 [Dipsacomyces acuminosporus]